VAELRDYQRETSSVFECLVGAGRVAAIEPSPEVLSWVRSRNIAWAKARKAAAA
jgi:hypothetical protein